MTNTRKLTMADLEDVYLDGFVSGVATCAINTGCPPESVDEFAQAVVAQMRADKPAMQETRTQIRERLTGTGLDKDGVTLVVAARTETDD